MWPSGDIIFLSDVVEDKGKTSENSVLKRLVFIAFRYLGEILLGFIIGNSNLLTC